MIGKPEKNFLVGETDVIKFCATVLITISHLDAFFPNPKLASGGAIGNALFFFVSGYGLAKAFLLSGCGDESFIGYIKKRYLRIYPAVWVVVFALLFLPNAEIELGIFQAFFWPTNYWFVSAIVAFYVPFYWIRQGKVWVYWAVGFLLFALYVLNYLLLDLSAFSIENGYFKWIYYFGLMVFGGVLANFGVESGKWLKHAGFLACYLILYAFLKLKLFYFGFGEFQFLFQLLAFPICYELYQVSKAAGFLVVLAQFRVISVVVVFLAGLTLEIYLVQVPLIHWLGSRDLNYSFPIPLLFAVLPIVPLAFLLNKISRVVFNLFTSKAV